MLYLVLALLLIMTPDIQAHGVSHILLHEAQGAKLQYADGAPLEFADVLIFRPGDSELEFQAGMTDENGIFMFHPDTSGVWTMQVSDGLGHGDVIKIPVETGDTIVSEHAVLSRWQIAISGVGYILFGFSIWNFLATRKKGRHAHS